jgi:ribosomal protein S18 acetylase RimI-like enzyme
MMDADTQPQGAQMTIVLRQATRADTDGLRALLYYAIFVPADAQAPPRDIVDAPQLIPYVRDFGTQVGDIGVLAERAAQPIGAAWVRLMRGYGTIDAHTPELTVAVRPADRGRGIGSQLLHALFAITDRSYAQISLSVQSANPAYRLYTRFGFVVVADQDGSYTMVRSAQAATT